MVNTAISHWSVRCYGAAPGSHAHDHFQILWGLDGSLALEIDGKGSLLNAGSGIIIAPNERHDFESVAGSRCLVLDSADAGWAARGRLPQFSRATDLLARFISEALAQQLPLDPHYGARLLAQSWGGMPAITRARRDIDWPALTQWLQQHLARPLRAADLAEQACLSESQFRARCLEMHGCAPMQWLRQLRLERAQHLRAQGLGMAEVARLSGYDSPSALTAAMQRQGRQTGETRR